MPSLLEQLIREHGDELASQIALKLGISKEEAARTIPTAASVVLERFSVESRSEEVKVPAPSLDGILSGAGEQVTERIGDDLGIAQDRAALVVPMVLPVVLRFLVRRVPYGGAALSVLTQTVEKQGYGSIDELALRLVRRFIPPPNADGKPAPSIATRLGRFAGKWFPSDET